MNVNVAKRLIPARDINQEKETVSVAAEEELHEGGYKLLTLPKEIFTEENDNRQGGNTKKCNAEILKNAKPKEIVKVVNTENYQKSPNRVTSTGVRIFQIEDTNITNNRRLRKKSKQKGTEKSVAREN